jgi:hypothetical protein
VLRYPATGVGTGLREITRQAEVARRVDARHEDMVEKIRL